jgi:hypothetical protein
MAVAILLCLIVSAHAADGPGGSTDERRAKDLSVQLASKNQATVDQAVDEIHTLLESNPDESVGFCRKYWFPSLISASQFELADRLAFEAILATPWQTGGVEFLQETRVRMMLRIGQPAVALSDARSLFNVVSLRGTEHALLVVTECLKAVHGEDNAMLVRFRKEEFAGATTRPATDAQPTSPTMAEIVIDPSPYAAAISQWVSDDDQSRRAKGNLLLLSGRCEEAQTTFEMMYRLSDSSDRIGLAENVARAMKASDGTIGRANGYMLSQANAQKPE